MTALHLRKQRKGKKKAIHTIRFEYPLPTLKTLRVKLVSYVRLRAMNSRVLGADYFSNRQCVPKLVTEMDAKDFDHETSQELGKSTNF